MADIVHLTTPIGDPVTFTVQSGETITIYPSPDLTMLDLLWTETDGRRCVADTMMTPDETIALGRALIEAGEYGKRFGGRS